MPILLPIPLYLKSIKSWGYIKYTFSKVNLFKHSWLFRCKVCIKCIVVQGRVDGG